MSTAHTVLLTRPRAESEKLAAEVRSRGFEPFIEPMLEIVPLDAALPDLKQFQALIFTSANGVDAFVRLSEARDIPVFTVGNVTGARAASYGFHDINTGSGDLEELNKTLKHADLAPGVPVLHVSGEHTTGNIIIAGVPVEQVVAYRADKTLVFSAPCLEMIDAGDFAAALFYSPRTAENFTELVAAAGLKNKISATRALCISEAVVKCLGNLPWQDVQVANTPTRNGMLRLLDGLAAGMGEHTGGPS